MAIFNNKVKAAVLLVGIVIALYGTTAVHGHFQPRFSGFGTTGKGPQIRVHASEAIYGGRGSTGGGSEY